MPSGAVFTDLGWHRLKDLTEPEHLFQVSDGGVPATFAPLRSLGAASSLPVPATRLVGRDEELRSLTALLSPPARLVTLTGAGGSGKTRLAIALAASMVQAFRDGVYFVPLAAVTTREGMWAAIALALGTGGEGWDHAHLLESIQSRRLMLVLDNLEQLPDAPKVVAELLTAVPEAVVVATSRRPLHLQAEHEHQVAPLALPDGADLEHVEQASAALLFAQQAQLVRPDFALTPENSATVAAICQRLDGLPLAIELAASRVKLLSPAALLARLDETMGLGAPDVDRPTRQRTLQAAIGWSYDLLPPDLQRCFRQLGVFEGGCDLDAVAAVVAPDRDPLDMVAELVDVSLVGINDAADGEPRVTMLRTVSEFAVACMGQAGELDEVRRRHADHYTMLAQDVAADLWLGSRAGWTRDRLAYEHDNMASALTWALSHEPGAPPRDAALALRLGGLLWPFWVTTGRLMEGRIWLEEALSVTDDHDPARRARALAGAGTLAWRQGDHAEAAAFHAEALRLQRDVGDDEGAAFSLNNLGAQALERRELDLADQYFEDAKRLTKDPRITIFVLNNMGEVARQRGDLRSAARLLDEALAISTEVADEWLLAGLLNNVARVSVAEERLADAVVALDDALGPVRRARDRSHIADWSDALAGLACLVGRMDIAARLVGAADGVRDAIGIRRSASDDPAYDATCLRARSTLGPERFDTLYAEGRELAPEEAISAGAKDLDELRAQLVDD